MIYKIEFRRSNNFKRIRMFNIKKYLQSEQWIEKDNGLFLKGLKSIKFICDGKLMIALNFDNNVKHKHIVTCKTPKNKDEADTLFNLTMLNKHYKKIEKNGKK